MANTYEDLVGAVGPGQAFRRTRYGASTLFCGEPPKLYFDDEPYELVNISGSGSGAVSPLTSAESALTDINRIGVLRLVQNGRDIFRGTARKARAEASGGRITSGFALEKTQFDLADLQRRNAAALAGAPPAPIAEVDAQYKAFCADALSFVSGYLDRIERHFAPIEDLAPKSDTDLYARELSACAAPGWRSIVRQGNDLVIPRQRNKSERIAVKVFTERVLTRTLLGGEGWRRTYHKPMGYPGDFRIMNYIYDGDPVGENLKSKFLHLLSLVGAEPVKTRMRRLAELIVGLAGTAPTSEPYSVLSIGAGPTREADDILRLSDPGRSWRFTLLDQEEAALEYSIARLGTSDFADRVTAQALNASFKEMLDPSPLAATAGTNAVIYSAGLVDYLNPLLARRFVKRLYELLRPGSALIIGNVNDKNTGMLWPSEYVVDWSLFFRSHDEMLDMAAGLPGASISVESDSLDAVHFLVARKPPLHSGGGSLADIEGDLRDDAKSRS